MSDPPKHYTVTAAAEALGVTRFRIWDLIKRGELTYTVNPLDRRSKLIAGVDVARLQEFNTKKLAT